MKILAVDTSTHIASVAIADDRSVSAEYTLEVTNMHTARLIPLIDEVLRYTGCDLKQMDAFAVGLGPGSFTGVRIGVGTIKSICYALQKPVVGICTLDAIAFGLKDAGHPVCAMLDARRNEVYAAIYNPPPTRCSEVMCVSIERLAEQIIQPCLLVGNGVRAYDEQIQTFLGSRAICAEPVFDLPRASMLTQLALSRLRSGKPDDFMALTPIYVRRPEAEVQYETGRLGKKALI